MCVFRGYAYVYAHFYAGVYFLNRSLYLPRSAQPLQVPSDPL